MWKFLIIYIYICVCVCVCILGGNKNGKLKKSANEIKCHYKKICTVVNTIFRNF